MYLYSVPVCIKINKDGETCEGKYKQSHTYTHKLTLTNPQGEILHNHREKHTYVLTLKQTYNNYRDIS